MPELYPRARSSSDFPVDGGNDSPSATQPERFVPPRKFKSRSSGRQSSSFRQVDRAMDVDVGAAMGRTLGDVSKLGRLLQGGLRTAVHWEAEPLTPTFRTSPWAADAGRLPAQGSHPAAHHHQYLESMRHEEEAEEENLPLGAAKTAKGDCHRRASMSCAATMRRSLTNEDTNQSEAGKRSKDQKDRRVTPKSNSKPKRLVQTGIDNSSCIDFASTEDLAGRSTTPGSGLSKLFPPLTLGLSEDSSRPGSRPSSTGRPSSRLARPSSSGRIAEAILQPLTPTGTSSNAFGDFDDDTDLLSTRRNQSSRFEAMSRSSSGSQMCKLLGDDADRVSQGYSRRAPKPTIDTNLGGDHHGTPGAQGWSWSQRSTTASSLASSGSPGSAPTPLGRDTRPPPRQDVWEEEQLPSVCCVKSMPEVRGKGNQLDDLGAAGTASSLLRRRRLTSLSVDTQSPVAAESFRDKEIMALGKDEKIFDLYHWDEVLQEEGDGGKVVVCKPKGIVAPSAPSLFVMKIRSKESLQKQGIQEHFHKVQRRVLNLPPHPGVLPIQAVMEDERFYYIVMEKASKGAFFPALIKEYPDGHLPAKAVRSVTREILEAVRHVHQQGMLHRDLKPDNLVMQGDRVCLIDFDHADPEWNRTAKGPLEGFVGTVRFSAPETFLGLYSEESDLYSVGVILYLMLTGKMPYDDSIYERELRRRDSYGGGPSKYNWKGAIHERMKEECIDWSCNPWPQQRQCRSFCQQLLAFEPGQRPSTADDALTHAWFRIG